MVSNESCMDCASGWTGGTMRARSVPACMPIIACGARLCRHPIGQYAPHTAPEIAFWDAGLTLEALSRPCRPTCVRHHVLSVLSPGPSCVQEVPIRGAARPQLPSNPGGVMRAVMPYFATVGVLLLAGRSTLAAQAPRTTAEIGTSVGVTILSQSGFNTQTHIGVPGGVGPISVFSPMLYASFFASPSVMVEPQVSFSSTSSGGTTDTFLWFAGQLGYLFTPNAPGSPYLAVNGAYQRFSETGAGSVNGPGIGGAVGYRVKVKNSVAIRVDGRYRRWFSDFADLNEIGVSPG